MWKIIRNCTFVAMLAAGVFAARANVKAAPYFDCFIEYADCNSASASLQLCGFFQTGTACDILASECDSWCASVCPAYGSYYYYGQLYYCTDYSGGNYADAGCFCY